MAWRVSEAEGHDLRGREHTDLPQVSLAGVLGRLITYGKTGLLLCPANSGGEMIHSERSVLAQQKVRIKEWVKHPQSQSFGGSEILIEDWWDRVGTCSWMVAKGNPACLIYAMRTGLSERLIPTDDEVLYGHTSNGLGHLIHISEIEENNEITKPQVEGELNTRGRD